MKHCMAPFHGKVSKEIADNEVYCPLCKGRMQAEKDLKKEKTKKALTTAAQIIIGAVPGVLMAADKISAKKKKS